MLHLEQMCDRLYKTVSYRVILQLQQMVLPDAMACIISQDEILNKKERQI